jgi:hypothetical protein
MFNNKKPRLAGRGKTKCYEPHSISSQSNRKRSFADYVLPTPVEYYSNTFSKISTSQEWAKVICPFHDDHHPSLSVNLQKGYFKCHSCDAKGGGIVKFHMMKYGLSFQDTVDQLEGGRW